MRKFLVLVVLAAMCGGCRSVAAIWTQERNPWNTEVIVPNMWGDAVDEKRDHDSEWASVAQTALKLPLLAVSGPWSALAVLGVVAGEGPIALTDINRRAAMVVRSMGNLKKLSVSRRKKDSGEPYLIFEFHEPEKEEKPDEVP